MSRDLEVAGDRFLHAVSDLTDEQARLPSVLPRWSRAHVIAHVALNGEAFVAVAAALRSGRAGVMYPDGADSRDRAIEELATAPLRELVRRVREANGAFLAAWDPPPPLGTSATSRDHPTFSSDSVPQRRLRELQVHLVDLHCVPDAISLWTQGFIDSDLRLQWATVDHRTTHGVLVEDESGVLWRAGPWRPSAEPIALRRAEMLAWVLDRAQVSGLPTLEPWSDQSRWEHLASGG